MSDADTSKESSSSPDDTATTDTRSTSFSEQDWFLQDLVNLANKTDTSIGITLTVGGALVSGKLASGKEYFEEFGKRFARGFRNSSPEDIASIEESYARYGEIYRDTTESDKPAAIPSYIHLKDVHIYFGPNIPIPSEDGNWWRGRISEVQGFVLGSLGISN